MSESTGSPEPSGLPVPPEPSGLPAHRIGRRRLVAVTIAVVMLLGIVGLVAVALVGDDSTPTGEGLQAPIDVAAPATAAPTAESAPEGDDHGDVMNDAAAAPAPPADDAPPATGDDFDVDGTAPPEAGTADPPPAGPVAPGGSLLPLPTDADLPEPSEPVQLPMVIAPPAPASTVVAMTPADFDPEIVAGVEDWDVTTRHDDYLELSDGSTIIEVFVLDSAPATADEALDEFFDGIGADLEQFDESSSTRLPAPASRYMSVSGAQFTAVDAQQQGTRTISGSALAGIDGEGRAVVVTASRPGGSSLTQRTADGERIAAVLAHVTP